MGFLFGFKLHYPDTWPNFSLLSGSSRKARKAVDPSFIRYATITTHQKTLPGPLVFKPTRYVSYFLRSESVCRIISGH